jgi:hypothetical protein
MIIDEGRFLKCDEKRSRNGSKEVTTWHFLRKANSLDCGC